MSGLIDLEEGAVVTLPGSGPRSAAVHVFEGDSILAINMALAASRPLLVRGEPGTGKSQLARAVACALGRVFLSQTVHARTEAQDLFWHLDAVARLAEAQIQGVLGSSEAEARSRLDVRRFLYPGPLWWAFSWASAAEQAERSESGVPRCEGAPENGAVVLLDEIDKADSSVPNGLLEALGDGMFEAPGFRERISMRSAVPPLIVATTNEERVLPDAFLRRCIVLQLSLPEDTEELVERLMGRGRAHHEGDGHALSEAVLRKAAELLAADRSSVRDRGLVPPGQAEYLDLLRAVSELHPGDEKGQMNLLEAASRFALQKHPAESGR